MKALKWIGVVLGGLVGVLLITVLALYLTANSRLNNATDAGRQLNEEIMPWVYFRGMTDAELQAIWRYLQSLPAQ